jgi:hypothetical protein
MLGGHVTVVAARTGAVVWQSPVTSKTSCALSGDRLVIESPNGAPGVSEYEISTHHLVFTRTDGVVYRYAPGGYVAMCGGSGPTQFGITPSGATAWTSPLSCDTSEVVKDFGRSITDSFVDIDIATGKVLGAVVAPAGTSSFGGYPSANRAVFYYRANPRRGCISDELVAFEGPYGASHWLPAAIHAGFDFSNRSIPVLWAAPGGCGPAVLAALNQNDTIRWVMPADLKFDLSEPIGNDMATNGGDESSALLALETPTSASELHNLELVALP